MKRFHPNPAALSARRKRKEAGMATLTEVMVAAVTTAMVVGASALGLRSTGSLISQSTDKATLRQNTVNGLRLMRSEIERSIHLALNKAEGFPEDKEHLNLSSDRYANTLNQCELLAGNRKFVPILATKMVELSNPVVYGMSTNTNGYGYTILRCGAPLTLDGRYNETEELFLSTILEDIGSIPCKGNDCPEKKPLAEYLEEGMFTFTNGLTPIRSAYEPALRIETDSSHKLVKFVRPTETTAGDNNITASFLEKRNNSKTITKQNLYFTSFARADKRLENFGEDGESGPLNGAFFQNITSSNVRFVIDGSGSMSACVMWGDGYGSWRTFYDPNKKRYRDTRKICALTRMEALISEMTMILEQLPDDTNIGIAAFSSGNYQNNQEWEESSNGLVRLGDEGKRESALAFVNSLDEGKVSMWGGTDPWPSITNVFEDKKTDTLYLLTDGEPDQDPDGGRWKNNDHEPTALKFSELNNGRSYAGKDQPLIVNTTSIDLKSNWLMKLSELTGGTYLEVGKDNNGHGNNLGDCDPSNPSFNFDHCNGDDDIELNGGQTP